MGQKPLDRKPTWEAIVESAKMGCGFMMLGRGKFTLVDEDVMMDLECFNWACDLRGYVKRSAGPAKKREVQYLHRRILEAPPELEVDHRNNAPLDNRRDNLRLATEFQQKGNRKCCSSHGFKGVRQQPGRITWEAKANHEGKTVYLGTFKTPEEAARSYDKWVKAKRGDFAKLNFP